MVPAATEAARPSNPCAGTRATRLLCPNLRIAPPRDVYAERTGNGHVRLEATSDVRSRGRGPMELRGIRNGPRSMRVNQRIYKAGRGHITVATRATLHFTDVGAYFGGSYWKVHQLARFELWSVNRQRHLVRRVRVGPKLNYCLRDLERTGGGKPLAGQLGTTRAATRTPFQDRVTLGTSVGWSDIYPADYDKQWIDVTGLRGCFAFVMRVDPQNLLYESDEGDNRSRRLVRLPLHRRKRC